MCGCGPGQRPTPPGTVLPKPRTGELTSATPARPAGLRLRADVDWDAGGGRYEVRVGVLAFDAPSAPAEVWLDDRPLSRDAWTWDAASRTLLLRFANDSEGHWVRIK